MRHANSNLNILNKNRHSKTIKANHFLKPSSINNFNSSITTKHSKNAKNKNINNFYNLLYKDNSKISFSNTKNTTNTIKNISEISNNGKYSLNNKNLCSNSVSISNSINYKDITNKRHKGHINKRVKLNNEIFNKNYISKNKLKHKTINYDMMERIKEKDSYIIKLQKDLLQSQEFLNKLQKEKQKEISYTYNSIKSADNMNININTNTSKNNYNINDFLTQTTDKNDRILKTNFNRYEMGIKKKNNINRGSCNNILNYNKNKRHKNIKALLNIDNLFNSNYNINKGNTRQYKNNISYKNNYSRYKYTNNLNNKNKNNSTKNSDIRYFSSSPNRKYLRGSKKYELCLSLSKNDFKRKNSEKKISVKKQNNIKSNLNDFPELKNLISKCNLLKDKANKILSNYISLTEKIINDSKTKK